MSFGNTITSLQHARLQLHEVFNMTEEDPNWVMGFKLIKDRDLHTIAIDHSPYIDAIFRWFNMAECDSVDTPMVPNKTLSKFDCPTNDNEKQVMSTQPYQELVRALIWLSITSCPDISFMATHLAKFNSNPGYTHWTATKHVLCYLRGTRHRHLTLGLKSDSNTTKLIMYTDSDWAHQHHAPFHPWTCQRQYIQCHSHPRRPEPGWWVHKTALKGLTQENAWWTGTHFVLRGCVR